MAAEIMHACKVVMLMFVQVLSLGFAGDGLTTYYSANVTKDEAAAVRFVWRMLVYSFAELLISLGPVFHGRTAHLSIQHAPVQNPVIGRGIADMKEWMNG